MAFKAEILQDILSNAQGAKSTGDDLSPNTYEKEEFHKKWAAELAMTILNEGEFYSFEPAPGEVEFDQNGNLKKIARTATKYIDLDVFTSNLYQIEDVYEGEGKDKKLVKTYVRVVLGSTIVNAITNTAELPAQIKVFRFKKHGNDWRYDGAEMIKDHQAREYSKKLSVNNVLKLMAKIRDSKTKSDQVEGDDIFAAK